MQKGDYDKSRQLLLGVIPEAMRYDDRRCLAFCYKYLTDLEEQCYAHESALSWAQRAKKLFSQLTMKQEVQAIESQISQIESKL